LNEQRVQQVYAGLGSARIGAARAQADVRAAGVEDCAVEVEEVEEQPAQALLLRLLRRLRRRLALRRRRRRRRR